MTSAADLEWVAARDGSRTARVDGRWLAGCSVPKRAAEMMLRKLVVRGNVACLLCPSHAQQVATCFDRLDPSTALIAIVADARLLELMQQCYDFGAAVSEGRLFFATDETSLRAIFSSNPGLAIPQQFIRLPITPQAESDSTIQWAQRVYSEVGIQQAQQAAIAKAAWKRCEGLCVVVARRFKLWDDAGEQLARCLNDQSTDVIDVADPRHSATGYIAAEAAKAGAMVTANSGRADQRDLIAASQPWISWITQPRVPAFLSTSPRDALVLAHESLMDLALRANWPKDRIRIAAPAPVAHQPDAGALPALLADVPDLTSPQEIQDYSSWRVIWDAVRKDLIENPHRLAGDIDGYLEKARRHFGVPADGFPAATFIDRLIEPAYVIGIAKWLAKEKVAFTVHGHGWDRFETVSDHWQGAMTRRDQLDQVLAGTSTLINPFLSATHPASNLGLPLVRTFGRTPQRILQDIRATPARQQHSIASLSFEIVRSLL